MGVLAQFVEVFRRFMALAGDGEGETRAAQLTRNARERTALLDLAAACQAKTSGRA